SPRSSVGGAGSTAPAFTSRISSATRRLNRTLLNEATVPAIPMSATIAHETSQSTCVALGAQLCSEVVEVARRDLDRSVRLQIRLSVRAELERPRHERGPNDDPLRRSEISEMGGHHHHFVKLQVEKIGGGLVDLAIGLVVTRQLRAENAIPRQPAELGEVRHQRDVAVRQRRDDELLLQPRQTADRIRP